MMVLTGYCSWHLACMNLAEWLLLHHPRQSLLNCRPAWGGRRNVAILHAAAAMTLLRGIL